MFPLAASATSSRAARLLGTLLLLAGLCLAPAGPAFASGAATPTTTSLSTMLNPAVYGQLVTLTATVSSVSRGPGTPTGTVTFFDSSTSLGTGMLAGGVATLTTSTLDAGTHTITASYAGDIIYNPSVSTAVSQVVNRSDTSVALSSDPNPSYVGQLVHLTAEVAPIRGGRGVPDGVITFTVDSAANPITATLSAGSASANTSGLAAGTHTIVADYGGSAGFKPSASSPITQTVNKLESYMRVTQPLSPTMIFHSATFTVTVDEPSLALAAPLGAPAAPERIGPQGVVTFTFDSTAVLTATLSNRSTASVQHAFTRKGLHPVTVDYAGDSRYAMAPSRTVTHTVESIESLFPVLLETVP